MSRLVAIALLVGCAEPDMAMEVPERLQPQYVELDDGSMQFHRWFDEVSGVACNLDITNDGEVRCVPPFAPPERINDTFSDDACLNRDHLAYFLPEIFPEPVVVGPLRGPTYRRVGALVTPYIRTADGRCVRRDHPGYRPGSPVEYVEPAFADPEDAVPAMQFREGRRLRARRFVTEDGAQLFAGWYDTELDVRCEVKERDGVRCWPEAAPVTPIFTDASCTQTGALVSERLDNPFATDGLRYFRVGGANPGPSYLFENGECVAMVLFAFREAIPVDPSIFVSAVDE